MVYDMFPKRDTKVYYDFGNEEDQEWLVEEILAHKWTNNDLELQVNWTLGDITWELQSSCKDLEALDAYFKSFLWVSWDLKVNLFWIAARYVVTGQSKKRYGNRLAIPML